MPEPVPYGVYISGPMAHVPEFNFPLFNRVAKFIAETQAPHPSDGLGPGRKYLVHPINPAYNFGGDTSFSREVYLELALRQVDGAQAIVMLPGWQQSPGARLELARALHLKLDVWYWHDQPVEGRFYFTKERNMEVAAEMRATAQPVSDAPSGDLRAYWERAIDAEVALMHKTRNEHLAEGFQVKDSGARQEYASGMRRDTQEGKPDYTLLPLEFLERWAAHMTKGAVKYGRDNWRLADSNEELTRFRGSALRHMMQWLRGDQDEDHASAVAFNVAAAEYVKSKPKLEAA